MLLDIRCACRYGKYKHDGQNYAVKFMKKHEIIKLKQVGLQCRLHCRLHRRAAAHGLFSKRV